MAFKVADFGLFWTKMKSRTLIPRRARNLEMARWRAPELLELTRLKEDEHESSTDSDWDSDSSDEMIGELPQNFTFEDMARADIYNFAITCSQILTGEDPYPELSLNDLVRGILGGLRPGLPPTCPAGLRDLLNRCWGEKTERPSFEGIFSELIDLQASLTRSDTVGNYKNNITESSSSRIDSFELELVPEHSEASGQSRGGPESSSARDIHQTVSVPEEHSKIEVEQASTAQRRGLYSGDMEVVEFVSQLRKALWNLKVMYDQHVENGNEIKELQSFIQDYDHHIPLLQEHFQEGGSNVVGIAAFKNSEKVVMEATNKLERWSRNESFFRVFNSAERMHKLGKLHSKVMASVQKSLGIANLSMLLDLQATQATLLESNLELKSLLITNIGSMHGTLPTKVRDEVVEASTSSFGDPKFWEDILAAVDNHNAGVSSLEDNTFDDPKFWKDILAVVDNHNVGVSSLEDDNMYEDPITTDLMIDPIVASDGNTYCRWTIIDNNLTTNPFNMDEDLTILVDNLTFRRGLFEKFPEQAQIFRQRRNQYRSHALSLKAKGLLSDAVLALQYVLQWDKRDLECVKALKQVQGDLQEAKEMYLQPYVGLSNEGKWGPIKLGMHEMVVGTPIDLNEAYKLFPSLSSSIPEVRQQAACGICQWSGRDVEFQSYIIRNGGIPFLATLLPTSDEITQEYIVSILLDISRSSYKCLDPHTMELVAKEKGYMERDKIVSMWENSFKDEKGVVKKGFDMMQRVDVDDMICVMKKMKVCFEEHSAQNIEKQKKSIFIPSALRNEGGLAHQGRRKLNWNVIGSSASISLTYIGRRLQCEDLKRTLLTPGFFLCLQVVLERKFGSKSTFQLEKNMVAFAEDGMEVLVEHSGELTSCNFVNGFIDIMVQSLKTSMKTLQFVKEEVMKPIQRLCTSPTFGCQSVTFSQSILRPECVEHLWSCNDRRDQAINERVLIENVLSKEDFKGYIHHWPDHHGDEARKLLGDVVWNEEIVNRRIANMAELTIVLMQEQDWDMVSLKTEEIGPLEELQFTSLEGLYKRLTKDMGKIGDSIVERVSMHTEETICGMRREVLEEVSKSVNRLIDHSMHLFQRQVPCYVYVATKDLETSEWLISSLVPGLKSVQLHLMCEQKGDIHTVDEQIGVPLLLESKTLQGLRPYVILGLRTITMLMKVSANVGAGFGSIKPDLEKLLLKGVASVIPNVSSDLLGLEGTPSEQVNLMKLKNYFKDSEKKIAEQWLMNFLVGRDLQRDFGLQRVRYIDGSNDLAWVCQRHVDEGQWTRILELCPITSGPMRPT